MTGAYVRVQRSGLWINLEIEELTADELQDFFKDRSKEEILRWLILISTTLGNVLREVV